MNAPEPIIHMVLVRPKQGVDPGEFGGVEQAFSALVGQIDGLQEVRCGANVNPEQLDRGFTWAAAMRLRDAAARDAYIPHEAHRAAAAKLGPLAADVLVCDITGSW